MIIHWTADLVFLHNLNHINPVSIHVNLTFVNITNPTSTNKKWLCNSYLKENSGNLYKEIKGIDKKFFNEKISSQNFKLQISDQIKQKAVKSILELQTLLKTNQSYIERRIGGDKKSIGSYIGMCDRHRKGQHGIKARLINHKDDNSNNLKDVMLLERSFWAKLVKIVPPECQFLSESDAASISLMKNMLKESMDDKFKTFIKSAATAEIKELKKEIENQTSSKVDLPKNVYNDCVDEIISGIKAICIANHVYSMIIDCKKEHKNFEKNSKTIGYKSLNANKYHSVIRQTIFDIECSKGIKSKKDPAYKNINRGKFDTFEQMEGYFRKIDYYQKCPDFYILTIEQFFETLGKKSNKKRDAKNGFVDVFRSVLKLLFNEYLNDLGLLEFMKKTDNGETADFKNFTERKIFKNKDYNYELPKKYKTLNDLFNLPKIEFCEVILENLTTNDGLNSVSDCGLKIYAAYPHIEKGLKYLVDKYVIRNVDAGETINKEFKDKCKGRLGEGFKDSVDLYFEGFDEGMKVEGQKEGDDFFKEVLENALMQ